jgi:hypothetical protein
LPSKRRATGALDEVPALPPKNPESNASHLKMMFGCWMIIIAFLSKKLGFTIIEPLSHLPL